TVFALYETVQKALLGKAHDKILRYGLQNTRSTITGIHADRTAKFAATAFLSEGLEGWLKESTAGQVGNILVHTKLVIADFTSNQPTLISGSHNLSANASGANDENFLIIKMAPGDTQLADIYGVELMRLYDHYRFVGFRKEGKTRGKPAVPPILCTDDTWTKPYYGGDALKTADRERFAGN